MRASLIAIIGCLLICTSLSVGQPFTVTIVDADYQLTGHGGGPLPDGAVALLFSDANNNGQTCDDAQPIVGTGVGEVNINVCMVGADLPPADYIHGTFTFNSPQLPLRLYLVIPLPDFVPDSAWVSDICVAGSNPTECDNSSVENWRLMRFCWFDQQSASPAPNSVHEYSLSQNYPNPFNPSTSITFDVKERDVVSLAVYNLMGQRVALLSHQIYEAGRHHVNFDAGHLPSGLYLYSIKIGSSFADTKKMLLVK